MDKPVRVKMNERDFQDLCQGKEVVLESISGVKVRMILADIGFDRMEYAIERARNVGNG